MCPNHVEHFLDSNLVSSTSLTERLKVWQKFARAPLNPDSIRIEFFRKVRFGKLFRAGRTARVQKPPELRINVPNYVKQHYQQRVQAFPAENSDQVLADNPPVANSSAPSGPAVGDLTEEQKEWLTGLIALQTSVLKVPPASETVVDKLRRVRKKKVLRKKRVKKIEKEESERPFVNGSVLEHNGDEAEISREDDEDSASTASECSLGLEDDDDADIILSSSTRDELREYLAKCRNADIDSIDPSIVKFLAAQKLSNIFPKPISVDRESEVRARAALVPLYQTGTNIIKLCNINIIEHKQG